MPRYAHVEWTLPFEPGGVEVRGYANVGDAYSDDTFMSTTPGEPIRLRASIMDQVGSSGLALDGSNVGKVMVEVLDGNDNVVDSSDSIVVTFSTSENGKIVGTGNGNPNEHASDILSYRGIFHGLVMGWIVVDRKLCANEGDEVVVKVEAEGLEGDTVSFKVRRGATTTFLTSAGSAQNSLTLSLFCPRIAVADCRAASKHERNLNLSA